MLKGWSAVDNAGNPTYEPEEDRVFIHELQGKLKPDIHILDVFTYLKNRLKIWFRTQTAKTLMEEAVEVSKNNDKSSLQAPASS
jgi:hypothetical protein